MNSTTTASTDALRPTGSGQHRAPYAEALRAHARRSWVRLNVPGHAADTLSFEPLTSLLGPELLRLDFPPLLDGIDLGSDAPLHEALALAADAWGARRTWFLTNGASQGNQIASLVAPALGPVLVVQRSVHSSVIDGLVLSGLDAAFVQPSVDTDQGIAHGVTAEDLAKALAEQPDAAAAYVVSPSYFGAVADVRALADTAHAAGCSPDRGRGMGLALRFPPGPPRQRALPGRRPGHLQHTQAGGQPHPVGDAPSRQRPVRRPAGATRGACLPHGAVDERECAAHGLAGRGAGLA